MGSFLVRGKETKHAYGLAQRQGKDINNFLNPVLLSWVFCSSFKEALSDYWIMNFIQVSSASMWFHVEYPFLVIPRT